MESRNIYTDIARRTGGDIYIGVVGPVRTGKSTFIKRFMEDLVIPNIESEFFKERAVDELPQSAAGRTIMTTEPKFIPEEAVKIELEQGAQLNVRLIDCVGYIVPSSLGYIENEQPRMVMTPWFEQEIPFNMAAEIGTQKVIQEHSTIGLVVTTDGSISDIPRESYIPAERRVIKELQELGKPFLVIVNSSEPTGERAEKACSFVREQYGVEPIAANCADLNEIGISEILQQVLYEFPLCELGLVLPRYIAALPPQSEVQRSIYRTIREAASSESRMRDLAGICDTLCESEYIASAAAQQLDLGCGTARIRAEVPDSVFYGIVEQETGVHITDAADLISVLRDFAGIRQRYERLHGALDQVQQTGYGIVMPSTEELTLEEPEIVRQGGRYGVRLRASAPSIHLLSASIRAEVNPIVGSEKQSEELVHYLLSEFRDAPEKIWETNIFGKSLSELVREELSHKLSRMPDDARSKIRETLEKIINENAGGLICIIL